MRLCAEAARGLEVLHRHHLVHRDVTPGNLLLTRRPDGSLAVVVADLGVARSVMDSSAGAMVVGTPSYMAPEQADRRRRSTLGPTSTPLCAVAYALLTGGAAVPGADHRRPDGLGRPTPQPPPLAAVARGTGDPDGLFPSGLATDPHRRPPSAALLADAFDQLAGELEGHLPAPVGPPSNSRCRRTRLASDRCSAPPAVSALPTRTAGGPRPSTSPMTVLAVLLFAAFLAIVIAAEPVTLAASARPSCG